MIARRVAAVVARSAWPSAGSQIEGGEFLRDNVIGDYEFELILLTLPALPSDISLSVVCFVITACFRIVPDMLYLCNDVAWGAKSCSVSFFFISI